VPSAETRVAALSHEAVTHGPLAAGGGGKVHPSTVYVQGRVTTICPCTFTRGFVTIGWACPACEHSTVAPSCKM
jgi:hypothetical protein